MMSVQKLSRLLSRTAIDDFAQQVGWLEYLEFVQGRVKLLARPVIRFGWLRTACR